MSKSNPDPKNRKYPAEYPFLILSMLTSGRQQRCARIRTGSDWITTEANFGRIRTGSDCNFFENWRIRTGSEWKNVCCFDV